MIQNDLPEVPFRSHPPNLPRQDNAGIDVAAMVSAIWRGKWIIAGSVFLAVVMTTYYVFAVSVSQYRSDAVVILETQQSRIVDLHSVVGGLSGDTSVVNSEVEVLRARGLMSDVANRLGLENDPEFNAALRQPGLKTLVRSKIESLVSNRSHHDAEPSSGQRARRAHDAVINALLSKTSVRNIPLSLVFRITVETTDPEKSALIADTIVKTYIQNQMQVKLDATEQATGWLTERVVELQVQLEDAEARVASFSASTELVSVTSLQALERQLKDLRSRIAISQGQNAQGRAQTDLQSQRSEQQLEALQQSEADLENQIRRQGEDLIVLQQLTRESEANRLLYEYFLSRLKETSAQQGIQQADSRILSNAVVPPFPHSPQKSLLISMAAIFGLAAGTIFVVIRELRNTSFRNAKDLEDYTGHTVLGQIPLIPARDRKAVLTYLSDNPASMATEAVRNLRTSALLSNVDQPPQVILLTSSIPGEGKTTLALALAHNLAGMGKKVLVIEGDIRRRVFGAYFENLPESGLTSVLSGARKLEDAIVRHPDFGADILVGDKAGSNAADLFSSEKFGYLISALRAQYDAIIIDTPPLLVVPDARIIAQQADAVLLNVKWDATSKTVVDDALRLFRNANVKVTGLILSQISPKGMKGYGYGARFYAYPA